MNPKINRLSRVFFGVDTSEYFLIVEKAEEAGKLVTTASSMMKNGWIPLGRPFTTGNQIVQAMIR